MAEIAHLLSRAALYRAAARCLSYPNGGLATYLASEMRPWLAAVADVLPLGEDGQRQIDLLSEAIAALETVPLTLEEEYTYLFLREVRCSPYESSYAERPGAGQPDVMADVAAFYGAFGMRLSAGGELPHHIGVELEFVAVLLAKEAYALEQGWDEQAAVCREARSRFVREHIGRWMAAFARRVSEQARLPFYPALSALAAKMVAQEIGLGSGACSG